MSERTPEKPEGNENGLIERLDKVFDTERERVRQDHMEKRAALEAENADRLLS